MRKALKLLLASMAVVTSYTACTPEVDDAFDNSSAQRIAETLKNDQQILVSAPNGWRMAIYGNTDFGGYNLFFKFAADNTVEVANEIAYNPEDVSTAQVRETSHYSLQQSAGAILSFDTYNSLFHFFSDPVNPSMGNTGKGFEADLEYRIMSACADSVVLKGKKHNKKLVLLPVQQGVDVSKYIVDVKTIETDMLCANFKLTIGSKEYPATLSYRNLKITTTNEAGERKDVKCPFTVTPEGYEFYEPVTIDGQQLKGFKYVPASLDYPEFSNGDIKLTAIVPPINEQFINNVWYTSMSNLGAFGQMYWGYCNTNLMPVVNGSGYDGTLDYCYFGLEDGEFGLWYMIIGYWGLNGFDYELVGEDQITLVYNPKKNKYNADVFTGSNWLYLAAYFSAPFGNDQTATPVARTFKIETDNLKNPSWVTLTDVNNPDNVIHMTAAEIYGDLFNK